MDTGKAILGAAFILSFTIALAVAVSNYFSPYQICKREVKSLLDSEMLGEVSDEAKIRVPNETCLGSSRGYLP